MIHLFVLPFVLLVYAFFLALWVADLFFTVRSTQTLGQHVEVNPLVKLLIIRKRFLYVFKAIELGAFTVLVYFSASKNADYTITALLALLALYSLIAANGMAIYLESVGKTRPAVIAFLAACLAVILLVQANYFTFVSNVSLSESLAKSGMQYADLTARCSRNNITINASGIDNKTTVQNDLNLPIPSG